MDEHLKKSSIYHVAQLAGVSTATVNRALSGKERVRESTRQRVLAAAESLNYQPNQLASRLSGNHIKLGIALPSLMWREYGHDLLRGACKAFDELRDYRVTGTCYVLDASHPVNTGWTDQQLQQIMKDELDGLLIAVSFSNDSASKTSASLSQLKIPFATVGFDLPESAKVFAVQCDTQASGRMAAELLWNMLGDNAPVAIFTGQKDQPLHEHAIAGFKEMMPHCPLNLLNIFENYDDAQMAYHSTGALFRMYPEVRGVYVCSANSRLVSQRLVEMGLAGKVKLVTSDLYPELSESIRRGIVNASIFQGQYAQAYEAVMHMFKYLNTNAKSYDFKRIQPQVVMRANLESFVDSTAVEAWEREWQDRIIHL